MEHVLSFKMNDRNWTIIEGSLEDGKNFINSIDMNFLAKSMDWFGGFSDFTTQTIFINNNMCKEAKIYTLLHELGHCYIQSYIKTTTNLEYYEDILCDIVANSHYVIHDIVEQYRKELDKINDEN